MEIICTVGEREFQALRQEVETLRAEITKARQTILHQQEKEKELKERLVKLHSNSFLSHIVNFPDQFMVIFV